MQTNGYGLRNNSQAGHGIKRPPARSDDGCVYATGGRKGRLAASEVMDLAYEVTRTSAEIYELIADVAGSLSVPPQGNPAASFVPLQQYCASLREITAATQESERRIRVLESEIVSILPQILDAFLEDCWTALEIFNEVCGDLVGITVLDESRSPAMTAAETLIQAMERLGTCSDKVSGLPGTGMAVSHQCLAENVINLQNRAVDLIGKFAGSS